MGYIFEWDTQKAELNLQKHGVAFEEASTVFGIRWLSCCRIQTTQRRKCVIFCLEGQVGGGFLSQPLLNGHPGRV